AEFTPELVAGCWTAGSRRPARALVPGENVILFFAGKVSPAVAWLQVGGTPFGDELRPTFEADRLVLPDTAGLAWYVMVPDDGRVTADLADPACRVAVEVVAENGAPITGELRGKGAAVEVGAAAGKVARLTLTASGCPAARLANAALVVPGPAPTIERGPAPRHVLLLIMDSLRADRIRSIHPGARPEQPFLDGLVDKAAVFTQFYVQGNETKASHASVWTSLYPVGHKMIPPNSKISPDWMTVDEVARKAGLYTSGASGNGYITPKRGFGEAWDAYRNHIHEGGGLRAEDIAGKGWATLVGKETSPWFLSLGWIDTHVSWR